MLSQRRNGAHDWLHSRKVCRRDQCGKFSDGRIDVAPALPGSELRMLEELLDGIHSAVCNLRFFETRDDVAGGEAAEDFFDCPVQVAPIRNPSRSRLEARIRGQFSAPENYMAESFPFAIVLNTQENGFLILALKGSIRSDRGVSGACPRRRFAAIFRVVCRISHPFTERFK